MSDWSYELGEVALLGYSLYEQVEVEKWNFRTEVEVELVEYLCQRSSLRLCRWLLG